MKESKRLYYSYNFLQQYLTEGKNMGQINFDPVTQMYVAKCLEEINNLKDAVLIPGNLAFTKNYNEEIPNQNFEEYQHMTFGRGFSIQSQKSLG